MTDNLMKWFLGMLLGFLVVSCATDVQSAVTPRPEVIRSELMREIDSGRPERALQRISALRRGDVIPEEELDTYYATGVDRIRRDYEEAVDGDRPVDAMRALQNLVTLGAETADPELISTFVFDYARSLLEAGNKPAALAVLLEAPRLSSMPPEALDTAVSVAVELNNRYAVSILAEILGPAWREDNPEAMEFASSSASPVEMGEGVVTVWVNRGLRLERGVGIPDRVIGSGFFVDPRGYIVTNYHVIASEVDPEYEGYSRLYVRLSSDPDERVPARVVGYSKVFDVALLKIEVDAPYVFSFTDIRSLEPGTPIMAIGSPGGLQTSITSGIISATGRRFLPMGDAMQVDVPINPGSSGGPLLDRQGRLVGVVFAGIEQYEGVNFAVPSYWVHSFFPDLYEERSVVHPWMGVAVEETRDGLEVIYVAKNSSADQAGLVVGDLITGIGDWSARKIGSAQARLLQRGTGGLVTIRWERAGRRIEGLVWLDERPARPVEVALDRDIHDRLYPVLFGMQVERIGGFSFNQNYRVTRVYRGSIADETGVAAGDTFTERDFFYDEELDVVFLRMFIRKRTEGFMRTSIQLPAYVERDNFL